MRKASLEMKVRPVVARAKLEQDWLQMAIGFLVWQKHSKMSLYHS